MKEIRANKLTDAGKQQQEQQEQQEQRVESDLVSYNKRI